MCSAFACCHCAQASPIYLTINLNRSSASFTYIEKTIKYLKKLRDLFQEIRSNKAASLEEVRDKFGDILEHLSIVQHALNQMLQDASKALLSREHRLQGGMMPPELWRYYKFGDLLDWLKKTIHEFQEIKIYYENFFSGVRWSEINEPFRESTTRDVIINFNYRIGETAAVLGDMIDYLEEMKQHIRQEIAYEENHERLMESLLKD